MGRCPTTRGPTTSSVRRHRVRRGADGRAPRRARATGDPDRARRAVAGAARGGPRPVARRGPRTGRSSQADATDPASLAALAGATRVVVTTVGPYARYGLPLVEACARAGTHYADLTGEVLFVREAIDRVRRARPGDRRADRARLRLRLGPVGPGRPAAARARGGRRRGRAARRAARRDRPRRAQRRHDRLDPRAGRHDAPRPGSAPAGRRSLRAEPGPRRGAGRAAAVRRRPPRADQRRPLDRAVRHGGVQHADRAPQQRPAGLRLRPRAPVRGGDGHRPRTARGGGRGRGHRRAVRVPRPR